MHTTEKPWLKPLQIMVVDDSISERKQLKAKLEKLGHTVIENESGPIAIEYLFNNIHRIDLIILDVQMPEINGFEVARRIRELELVHEEEWHPIIFLSNSSSSEMIASGIKAGGDDYLCKPVDTIVLQSKINAMQRIAHMRLKLLEANKQLNLMALTDELTKLPNRRHFINVLNTELARAKRHQTKLTLVYLDLDHFKSINDNYGHETGDFVLKSVADVLANNLRSEDTIGRMGGEEFCICLTGTNKKYAMETCERYRLLIQKLQIPGPDTTIQITASFGITELIPDSDTITSLLARADKALYQAKNNGRNQVIAL